MIFLWGIQMIEFFWAYFLNFVNVIEYIFVIFGILFGVIYFVLVLVTETSYTVGEEEKNKKKIYSFLIFIKKLLFYIAPISLFLAFPSPEDLWKVRINLVKYELASPKNVNQGAQKIQEIADKLEKKYLGDEK